MRTTEPTRYGVREARRNLPTLIADVADRGAVVVITSNGQDRVVVLPAAELERILAMRSKPARRR